MSVCNIQFLNEFDWFSKGQGEFLSLRTGMKGYEESYRSLKLSDYDESRVPKTNLGSRFREVIEEWGPDTVFRVSVGKSECGGEISESYLSRLVEAMRGISPGADIRLVA